MAKDTRKKIIDSLIILAKHKRIDDITVTELINYCNINRKTFYYHFNSIGSLLSWYICFISTSAMKDRTSPTNWKDGYIDVLTEFLKEKEFLINAFSSKHYGEIHKNLHIFFYECIQKNLGEVINDIKKQNNHHNLTENRIASIMNFYAAILQSSTEQWIINGMIESIKTYADMLYGIFNDSIYQVISVI